MTVVKQTNLKKLTLWISVILEQIVVAQLFTNSLHFMEPRILLSSWFLYYLVCKNLPLVPIHCLVEERDHF